MKMTRKGYREEYEAKKQIESQYGEGSAVKIAVSGFSDFLVLPVGTDRAEKLVEVKRCSKKKWYPDKRREVKQLQRAVSWCRARKLRYELWIKYPRRGWQVKLEKDLAEYLRRAI